MGVKKQKKTTANFHLHKFIFSSEFFGKTEDNNMDKLVENVTKIEI